MTRQEVLAETVLQSRGLMLRYLKGFDDSTHTKSAEGLPNHVAWCLGHCALMMHRGAERLDGQFKIAEDFLPGVAECDGRRFGTETVAFGSDPNATSGGYPNLARCIEIFGRAAERLAAAISACPEHKLEEQTVFFGGATLPRWNVAPRAVFHNGFHCGQIADLRRALRMPPIFA